MEGYERPKRMTPQKVAGEAVLSSMFAHPLHELPTLDDQTIGSLVDDANKTLEVMGREQQVTRAHILQAIEDLAELESALRIPRHP